MNKIDKQTGIIVKLLLSLLYFPPLTTNNANPHQNQTNKVNSVGVCFNLHYLAGPSFAWEMIIWQDPIANFVCKGVFGKTHIIYKSYLAGPHFFPKRLFGGAIFWEVDILHAPIFWGSITQTPFYNWLFGTHCFGK